MNLELEINELGAAGDGIGRADGQTYYVPYTVPGDHVTIRPLEKQGKGIAAEVDKIRHPSADRIKAKCKHFGTCGGCSLQHVNDQTLAHWKQELIEKSLQRAGIFNSEFEPILTSPERSRRRVEFVASKRKKGVMVGYHIRRSHQIFDVGECPLITKRLQNLIQPLRTVLSEIMPRNSKARLTLTDTENGADLLITSEIEVNLQVREMLAQFAGLQPISRISWYDTRNRILEKLCELKPVEIPIGDHRVPLSPGGFLQATQEGQNSLIELVCKHLPPKTKTVDLFAGCGSFTLPAARFVKSVYAAENDPALVTSLKQAANQYMLPVEAAAHDLFRDPLTSFELNKFECAIIDPPRAGALAQVTELAQSTIKTILFISCNPASFARDAKMLIDAGYRMGKITPIDQFRWSSHVEMFTYFTKP